MMINCKIVIIISIYFISIYKYFLISLFLFFFINYIIKLINLDRIINLYI